MLKIINTVQSAFQPHSLWLVRFHLCHPLSLRSQAWSSLCLCPYTSLFLPCCPLYLTHPYNWEHLKNRHWFLFIFVPSEPSWVLGFSWMFNWHWIQNDLQCGFHSPFLSHLQLFTQFTQFSVHIDYSSWLNKACSFILEALLKAYSSSKN